MRAQQLLVADARRHSQHNISSCAQQAISSKITKGILYKDRACWAAVHSEGLPQNRTGKFELLGMSSNYMLLGMTFRYLPVLQLIALKAVQHCRQLAADALLGRCSNHSLTCGAGISGRSSDANALLSTVSDHGWPTGQFFALKTAWGQLRQLIAGALLAQHVNVGVTCVAALLLEGQRGRGGHPHGGAGASQQGRQNC